MTNPIAVSQRARECLAAAYEQAGYRDEAAAFRAGDWTCHDHPALVAMTRFEAEIRADEQSAHTASCNEWRAAFDAMHQRAMRAEEAPPQPKGPRS